MQPIFIFSQPKRRTKNGMKSSLVYFFMLGKWNSCFNQKTSLNQTCLNEKNYCTFRSEFQVGWKNQNKHSTLNLSFDTLSKRHEPDITQSANLSTLGTYQQSGINKWLFWKMPWPLCFVLLRVQNNFGLSK